MLMAKPRDRHEGGHDRDDSDDEGGHRKHRHAGEGDGGGENEENDNPGIHAMIEERRFHGGLPATPERYARALEQWNRLPGAVVRPSTDATPPDENGGEP
jgi:hypothetical protein